MKKTSIIFTLAAMLVAMVSCTKEEQPVSGKFTMTVNADKGSRATKDLSLSGTTLNATWKAGEEVKVYKGETLLGTLTAATDGSSTTLSGTIEGEIAKDDNLTLKFLSGNYGSQNGTLEYIAANCDYATANITIKSISGGSVSTTDAVFANQQAIVKFTLRNSSNTENFSTSRLVVKVGSNDYTITPASATHEIFVALPGFSSQNVKLISINNGDYYLCEKTGITFANGQYYTVTVGMAYSDLYTPLTFEAKTAGSVVRFDLNIVNDNDIRNVQSSLDGITWETYTDNSAITLTNVGDKVMFRGNWGKYDGSKFTCSADCYVYGNVNSLQNTSTYPTLTSLGNRAFYGLFYRNKKIKNHATKDIVLPATTLVDNNCYNNMFRECTGLTRVPALPATTLGNYCYQNMFNGCTGLTTLPTNLLPATTLANGCYNGMFNGCSNLTNVPNLPATTLTERCYTQMFQGCTSLVSVNAGLLPATTLVDTTTSGKAGCYEKMFYNCSSLISAPILPAETLTTACYRYMFDGCTSLTSLTCFAIDHSAKDCTRGWLNKVPGVDSESSGTGTFYCNSSITDVSAFTSGWNRSGRGIPYHWTVQKYSE